MEIEELQATWSEMSIELEKQKRLTNEMIMKMTQQDFKSRINKIRIPEMMGAVLTSLVAVLLIIRFKDLDTLWLRLCGVFSLLVLLILPYVSIGLLNKMGNLDIRSSSYKASIYAFAKGKQRYQRFMKFTVYIGFVFMFSIVPVFSKIFNGEDLFTQSPGTFWYIFIPLAATFYFWFSSRVIRSYNGNIKKAAALIGELEQG